MSMSDPLSRQDLFLALQQQAHVWYCNPQAIFDADQLAEYRVLLSGAERKQQNNFHYKKDQRSYLVAHALVRKVLSMYVDKPPQDWLFSSGTHGKPRISESPEAADLRFNLTHTSDLCACVITRGLRCGIDAEHTVRQNKLLPIAKRMFAEAELTSLQHLSEAEFRQNFFYYWTLREAYVKARGTGLGGSSKAFHFTIGEADAENRRNADIVYTSAKRAVAAEWQFEIYQPEAMQVMAVALKSEGERREMVWRFMEP